jgi:hypothetical protein
LPDATNIQLGLTTTSNEGADMAKTKSTTARLKAGSAKTPRKPRRSRCEHCGVLYLPSGVLGICDDCFNLYCRVDRVYRHHPSLRHLSTHAYVTTINAITDAIRAAPCGREAVALIKRERFIDEWTEANADERAVLQAERIRIYFRTHCKRTARLPGAGVFH